MTLSTINSSVKIVKDIYDPFDNSLAFKQSGSLLCVFFNIMLENVICTANLNCSSNINSIGTNLQGYVVDIDIVGLEAKKFGLLVNGDEKKPGGYTQRLCLASWKQQFHP